MADAARSQHRPRRADHRHQHGLPGQEGLQQMGRLGADADEPLALEIVEAVVAVCAPRGVPVTLKMRTGWCHRAQCAAHWRARSRAAGVAMVTVHGRTREQGYKGLAEYDTIAAVKAALRIPVVANGDIDSPHKARAVLALHRRRRADDRPRCAGPAVDLPRDRRTFWRQGELAAPTGHARRRATGSPNTCTITTACTAKSWACAARASTSAGPCAPARR